MFLPSHHVVSYICPEISQQSGEAVGGGGWGWARGGVLTAVLNRTVRIALTGWMTFDQRPEELEGIWGRNEGGHVSQGGRAGWAKVQRLQCQDESEECQEDGVGLEQSEPRRQVQMRVEKGR